MADFDNTISWRKHNIYSNYLQRFQLQMERKQKTGEEKCQLI